MHVRTPAGEDVLQVRLAPVRLLLQSGAASGLDEEGEPQVVSVADVRNDKVLSRANVDLVSHLAVRVLQNPNPPPSAGIKPSSLSKTLKGARTGGRGGGKRVTGFWIDSYGGSGGGDDALAACNSLVKTGLGERLSPQPHKQTW